MQMICFCMSIISPIIFTIFSNFGNISGYKINWSKSAFLPLNNAVNSENLYTDIHINKQFHYLGLGIFTSINNITTENYDRTLNSILADLTRWSLIPQSIQVGVSVVKMNIMTRINFISSMIPLSPPAGHWNKLHPAITKLIWNNTSPQMKFSILQCSRNTQGQK